VNFFLAVDGTTTLSLWSFGALDDRWYVRGCSLMPTLKKQERVSLIRGVKWSKVK
jgi:hypothetical protein